MINYKDIPTNYAGIYCIRNVVNNKVYIGSSKNIRKRIQLHLQTLQKGTHHSYLLQRSWDKHGSDNFTVEVILTVLDITKMIEHEQYFLDLFQSYVSKNGYNLEIVANSSIGIKRSQEFREKISLSNKRRVCSEDTRAKHRELMLGENNSFFGKKHSEKTLEYLRKPRIHTDPFVCVNTGKIYHNSGDASRDTGVEISNICKALTKGTRSINYFVFITINDLIQIGLNKDCTKDMVFSTEEKIAIFKFLGLRPVRNNLTGEIFLSVRHASDMTDFENIKIHDILEKSQRGQAVEFSYL